MNENNENNDLFIMKQLNINKDNLEERIRELIVNQQILKLQ